MSGEELKKKLENAGISQAEIARRLGVIPTSVWQTLNADDIKTGFIEDLCRLFGLKLGFFYDDPTLFSSEDDSVQEELKKLRKENSRLKSELTRIKDPNLKDKSERIYNIWMKFMDVTEEMQELYKENKEE